MYEKITKEDLEKIFENREESQIVMFGSETFINAFEVALDDELKSRLLQLTDLEIKIIELRKEGLSYHAIQLALGNPSKKFIKDTLRKYAPELAGDIVKNYGRIRKT